MEAAKAQSSARAADESARSGGASFRNVANAKHGVKERPNIYFQNARIAPVAPSAAEMRPELHLPDEIVFFVRTRTSEDLPLPRTPNPDELLPSPMLQQ